MSITVRAELRVFAGKRDEFLKVANALAHAAADEPGTLRYDWYEADDPAMFVVLEQYEDAEAALAHNVHCADLLNSTADLAEMTTVQLHGDLNAELKSWIASQPTAHAYRPLAD